MKKFGVLDDPFEEGDDDERTILRPSHVSQIRPRLELSDEDPDQTQRYTAKELELLKLLCTLL